MMIDIASSLNYYEFDEVKDSPTAYEMGEKLLKVYGGDKNVKRSKEKILRGKFDQMKMKEGENISQYSERIKESVSAIRAVEGDIVDETMINKVVRTLLPIYAIRVSKIQEVRCNPNNDINLDALVGRLTAFELDNFDNFSPNPRNLESIFKAKLTLDRRGENSKGKQIASEEEDDTEEDLEIIESLLPRRLPKGKGKFKGKIPLIFFACQAIGHIATRC